MGIFIGVFYNSNTAIIGMSIIFLGIIIILMPFTTPETNELLGYKKAKQIGRLMGIFVIVIGVWIVYL